MYEQMTQRQIAIVKFIGEHIRDKGFPPTYDEICDALAIRSKSTASSEIHKLIGLGALTMDKKAYRSLGLTVEMQELLYETNDSYEVGDEDAAMKSDAYKRSDSLTQQTKATVYSAREDVLDIPIYGRVAAGSPIFAEDHVEDTIPLPNAFLRTGNEYFVLTVSGESMIEAGIFDGDQLIVKRQSTARNGEQVVALIDEEATVKTFFQRSGYVELRPENSSMDPIIVNDCTILGVVSGLYRIY